MFRESNEKPLTCQTCKFQVASEDPNLRMQKIEFYQCRYNPPTSTIVTAGGGASINTMYPVVNEQTPVCSHYAPAPALVS